MIEKEQILLLTQGGLNVFSHFLGFEVNLHRNFRSPFYDDRRASCHIYYDRKTSSYKFYDHGDTTYSGDCFWCSVLNKLTLSQSKRSKNLCLSTMNQRKYCYYISM